MLHSVEMTIEDLNIEIQIGAGGSIEGIFVEGQQPDGVEFDIIEENLQKLKGKLHGVGIKIKKNKIMRQL